MTRLIFRIKVDENDKVTFQIKESNIGELTIYQTLAASLAKVAQGEFSFIEEAENDYINIWLNVEKVKLIVASTYEKWDSIDLISTVISSLLFETLKGAEQ